MTSTRIEKYKKCLRSNIHTGVTLLSDPQCFSILLEEHLSPEVCARYCSSHLYRVNIRKKLVKYIEEYIRLGRSHLFGRHLQVLYTSIIRPYLEPRATMPTCARVLMETYDEAFKTSQLRIIEYPRQDIKVAVTPRRRSRSQSGIDSYSATTEELVRARSSSVVCDVGPGAVSSFPGMTISSLSVESLGSDGDLLHEEETFDEDDPNSTIALLANKFGSGLDFSVGSMTSGDSAIGGGSENGGESDNDGVYDEGATVTATVGEVSQVIIQIKSQIG